MKAILQSIKTQYCELIAAGKKTIEVRKTKPNIPTPFKVYIYCTKQKQRFSIGKHTYAFADNLYIANGMIKCGNGFEDVSVNTTSLNGKVIGEYVCNDIDKVVHAGTTNQNIELCFLDNGWNYTPLIAEFYRKSCLTYAELEKYSKGGDIYGYHISNLVIYDKPKELSEFRKPCKCLNEYEGEVYCDCLNCDDAGDSDYGIVACDRTITRPPQSWCYVEELNV